MTEPPAQPPGTFLAELEARCRQVEAGLRSGEYELRPTRLLLEPAVAGPGPFVSAHTIDDLERDLGPGYRLADGRTIEQLSPADRAALVEYVVLQPQPTTGS